ncbi:MAG TPA: MOSC and FAD-binding oxidoreductase domain-containing protein [Mycobacteriales bacterium]|nr:MOSC and FAD-binding oxidoreductase domain-containing protein [Mycobacteriales bacterium]
MATLVSVNVGLPRDVAWEGRTVHTGIWKDPVEGPRMVRRLNVDGDGQGDLAGHGGEQRAVFVYQLDSYRHWREHLGRDDLGYGEFGENFTVDGLPDDEVCIGDRYRIGAAEFEVTQPRVTCFRVGMRLREPRMPALLVAHHRPGFYLRVITEGAVTAGDPIVRTRVGRHAVSVAAVDALLYLPDRDRDLLRAAVDIPALSPGWQGSFRELLDAGPAAAAPPPPAWPGFRRLRVERVVPESATVTSVELAADDGAPLPPAAAGQYLTLRVAGAGDPAPVRSYSLSSPPGAATYRISVKREPHGVVSAYVGARLRPGAVLDAAAPRGEFVLADGTGPVLLLSAGIGVTPVLAMLHQLAAAGSARDVWWVHTARNAAEQAFAAEADRLLQALPHAHRYVFHTAPDGAAPDGAAPDGAAPAGPHGAAPAGAVRRGRPTAAALAGLGLPADATAYVCGPAAFMADMQATLAGLGIPPDRVHTELFGALAAINPGLTDVRRRSPHPPPGPDGTGPRVTFARSGLTVRWADRHGSLLDLADACEVPTRFSCRTGVCHTCVTPVLSGATDYSPEPLELPAAGTVLVCCARPDGDLVLDM